MFIIQPHQRINDSLELAKLTLMFYDKQRLVALSELRGEVLLSTIYYVEVCSALYDVSVFAGVRQEWAIFAHESFAIRNDRINPASTCRKKL
jgi:type III secretory pathway component EscU